MRVRALTRGDAMGCLLVGSSFATHVCPWTVVLTPLMGRERAERAWRGTAGRRRRWRRASAVGRPLLPVSQGSHALPVCEVLMRA